MKYPEFTPDHLAAYHRDGYVVINEFFLPEEVELLLETYKNDRLIRESAIEIKDKKGFNSKLTLWYKSGDDIYSAFSRSERVVDGVEMIFGDKAALYHTKLMQKEPKTGGAWEWHQDYGYWYENGFLFPDMLSVLVAVNKATKENGCLQVLRGSHKLGRINHNFAGEQIGADLKRVQAAMQVMELVYVELEPGDTLFFHGNLLHKSDRNTSDYPRYSLISAYNRAGNRSFIDEPESSHLPIEKIGNDMIMKIGRKGLKENSDILNREKDAEWKDSLDLPE